MRSILFLLFMVINFYSDAQRTSFAPGIYLEFEDFLKNEPVVLGMGKQLNHQYYYEMLDDGLIEVHLKDSVYEIDPKDLWGFADGKSVFVNKLVMPVSAFEFRDDAKMPWARVNIVGKICLIHYIPYMSGKVVRRPSGAMSVGGTRNRPSEYIMDMRNGRFYRPTLDNLERLIQDDGQLLEEFHNSEEDRVVKFYSFLKRYNERHPLEDFTPLEISKK